MKQRPLWPALYAALGFCGLLATFFLLKTPSEPGAAFLFGYSRLRLALAAGGLSAALICLLISALILRRPGAWARFSTRLSTALRAPAAAFAALAVLFAIFLGISALLVLALSPAAAELVILKTVLKNLGGLLVWALAAIAVLAATLLANLEPGLRGKAFFTPLRLAVLLLILSLAYAITLRQYMTLTWDLRMRRLEEFIYLPVLVTLAWGLLQRYAGSRGWYPRASRLFLLLLIGVSVYTFYRHSAQWMGWIFTPSKAYWHDLADAFLHGRLYLIDPESTHDLTLFDGHWYVPNPPLPGLILVPFVALLGHDGVNMVLFSITLGAVNAVLLFLALEDAARLGMIPTGRCANLVLTALFAAGTSHWWLSIMGRMWFLSQLFTLFFVLLAGLLVLRRGSPWLVGLCLGLAMASRPNAFTLWPFLAGTALYLQQRDTGWPGWRAAMLWTAQTAMPVAAVTVGLLAYNYVRFADWFDFGYVTINSASFIMEAARTYGIFNAHFIPANFHMMFLKLPILQMRGACFYFSPTHEGVSILALTPAMIFVLRRPKMSGWATGAWLSILLSMGLLLFYHNTGAEQMGYRYLMDFILPMMLLLAVGVGKKPSWLFLLLCVASFVLNAAGILWWFGRWPCAG